MHKVVAMVLKDKQHADLIRTVRGAISHAKKAAFLADKANIDSAPEELRKIAAYMNSFLIYIVPAKIVQISDYLPEKEDADDELDLS